MYKIFTVVKTSVYGADLPHQCQSGRQRYCARQVSKKYSCRQVSGSSATAEHTSIFQMQTGISRSQQHTCIKGTKPQTGICWIGTTEEKCCRTQLQTDIQGLKLQTGIRWIKSTTATAGILLLTTADNYQWDVTADWYHLDQQTCPSVRYQQETSADRSSRISLQTGHNS